MVKLTEKFQPAQVLAKSWDVYEQCSEAIGVILDNHFKDPHVHVYEHTRHTPEELFKHDATLKSQPFEPPTTDGLSDLAKEELEILSVFRAPETHRRLNVVGDVGVGKTTYIKHLAALHIGQPSFSPSQLIYIDFADFTASRNNALRRIEEKFVLSIWTALERHYGGDTINHIDDEIFYESDLFAGQRLVIRRLPEPERKVRITEALLEATKNKQLELTFARVNQFCKSDRNRLALVIDNIDHLSQTVLSALGEFLLSAQLKLAHSLLIVAMRDHTFNSGFSAYMPDRTVMCWNQRLNPPDLRKVLERRVEHFFPDSSKTASSIAVGSGVLQADVDKAKLVNKLITSPFISQEPYDFLCTYTNYNLRELFGDLQKIVGFHGFKHFDKKLLLESSGALDIGIDECLMALGLRRWYMFFPDKSELFNPYSAGDDTGPLDRIVAARILQLLDNRITWIQYKDLALTLTNWGYSPQAIRSQVAAMVNKDLVWTSAGSPKNFDDVSGIRLSYRGQLYARKILRRTIFNYMMSFDVEAPNENHPIFRHFKSEFMTELHDFADIGARFESDALAYRVLGLAQIIFDVELAEFRNLAKIGEIDGFRQKVAPKPISLGILSGLSNFLVRTHEKNGNASRFMSPSTDTLKATGERIAEYREKLTAAFGEAAVQ